MEPTRRVSPRGPFVGAEPPREAPERWAEHARLDRVVRDLSNAFGFQRWWPARTPFEVIVGAILTQNTAWTNVEKALARLGELGELTPGRILATDQDVLRRALVPSGYFNAKTKKLRAISEWYLAVGGLAALRERELRPLREELLEVHGVGPETADSILCYAAGRRTCVVDAYTRRLLARHGFVAADVGYEAVRKWLEERLVDDQFVYEEFHALVVRVGYGHCKPSPACESCPAATPTVLAARRRER
ncbi:MAG: endonuclease [Planctomycetes bacterium]|nr:endonuclease [Planctomycetota bacterium]